MIKESITATNWGAVIMGIIEQNGISAGFIADSIGMHRATFNNKLKGNNGSSFTIFEKDKVYKVFSDIGHRLFDEIGKSKKD